MLLAPNRGWNIQAIVVIDEVFRGEPHELDAKHPPCHRRACSRLFADAGGNAKAKILLIGKNPDHPYGSHMYLHTCGMLAKCLELTPGIETVVSNGWPNDPATLEGVKTIVVYTSPAAELLLDGPQRLLQKCSFAADTTDDKWGKRTISRKYSSQIHLTDGILSRIEESHAPWFMHSQTAPRLFFHRCHRHEFVCQGPRGDRGAPPERCVPYEISVTLCRENGKGIRLLVNNR